MITYGVTIYRGAKDETPILSEALAWPALVDELVDALALEAPKIEMLAWSPVRLREPRRANANVDAVTFLGIDVDAGDPALVLEALAYAGWAALVYASPSSTADAPRFRVVAPVSRELTPAECGPARLAFAEALGLAPGCGVEKALDPSRLYFIGRVPGTPAREHWRVDGVPVNVDALLAMRLEHAWGGETKHRHLDTSADPSPDANTARAEALAARLPPSVEGHGGDEALMIAARELATVLGEDARAIESVLTSTFNPRCAPAWPAAKLEREARRAAARQGEPITRALRAAREADESASWAHAPEDPPEGTPVLLRSRDGNVVMLWEGDTRGLRPIAVEVLRARVRELGLEAVIPLTDGKRARSPSAILDECTTYQQTRYDFARTVTTYTPDDDGTVTIGFAPRGPAPRYDADVDAWVRALGGPQYERLAAWVASCAQKNIARLAATLVIVGAPDVGKSLVGIACAATWRALPPPMLLVVRQFNGQMLECPIMVDEEAQLFGSRELSTKAFRDLAQATARGVEKKHQERVQLVGAQRYVVPCNDFTDIRFADLGGGDVVQALADRLLVIAVGERADACRAALARLRIEGAWTVDLERIAAHFAWLAETVALPVERFVGAGGDTSAPAILRGHVREHEELFDTLATWLDGSDAGRGPWYARDGRLYVVRRDVAASLEQRGRGWDLPRVTRALAPFGRGEVRLREGGRGTRQIRAWELDAVALAESEACDAEALVARLAHRGAGEAH